MSFSPTADVMLPGSLIESMLANPAVTSIGVYTKGDGTKGSQAIAVVKPGCRGAYRVAPAEWTIATFSLDAIYEDHFDAALTDPETQTSVGGGVSALLQKLASMQTTYGSLRPSVYDITD